MRKSSWIRNKCPKGCSSHVPSNPNCKVCDYMFVGDLVYRVSEYDAGSYKKYIITKIVSHHRGSPYVTLEGREKHPIHMSCIILAYDGNDISWYSR